MSEEIRFPVLPLRETVVFPGTAVPLTVGRPGSLAAVEAALERDRNLLLVAQRENREEVAPGTLYTVGTIVRIAQVQRGPDVSVEIIVYGEQRARVTRFETGAGGALFAIVRVLEDWVPPDPHDPAFLYLYHELRLRCRELGERRGLAPEMLRQFLEGAIEPAGFTDLMGFYLDIGIDEKQRLLETLSVEARVRGILPIVKHQIASDDARAAAAQGEPASEMPLEAHPTETALLGPSVFISYRRGSGYVTGRIYDRLVGEFGRESVFKDVDSIPLGVDFREHTEHAVEKCSVFIAVISSPWHERLHDPRDFVRVELETALRCSIPIIPVLLQDAVFPAEEDLPASLQSLVYRHGLVVRPDPDFSGDVDRLIRGIRVAVERP